MAITLTNVAASGACNAVVDLVDADASPGYLEIRDDTTVLVTITLDDPAFGAAANGVATAGGLPLQGTAVADGTADNFKVYDGADTEIWSGTVGGTLQATSGDLQLNSSAILTDDIVVITAFTHTAPTS